MISPHAIGQSHEIVEALQNSVMWRAVRVGSHTVPGEHRSCSREPCVALSRHLPVARALSPQTASTGPLTRKERLSMKITLLGAAGGEVTGSAYLLQTRSANVLIDCGLFQGSQKLENSNRLPTQAAMRQLDAVVLTHAH